MENYSRLARLRRIIKNNGGFRGCMRTLFMMDELKDGNLVGQDKFGNRYYQNNDYFFSSNRWVRYSERAHHDYNASQVPPEWHRWLHYMTDETPVDEPPQTKKWQSDHEENLTGTDDRYVPYSTTRPKIQSWTPPSKSS